MNSENYGTHIKHIRQKMGLTQNQVAEALGVTPGYISNVENNRTDHMLQWCNKMDEMNMMYRKDIVIFKEK